ncbi:unnamed protein product [Ostreobium quekettii]|uniref:Zinc/iron permease n=1 Tax=Ostreobium quekettii TaxID=121088 RepID=A0A8S1J2F3_9CHLO|nr:unnamed protein product [Ostreobium quekettii]
MVADGCAPQVLDASGGKAVLEGGRQMSLREGDNVEQQKDQGGLNEVDDLWRPDKADVLPVVLSTLADVAQGRHKDLTQPQTGAARDVPATIMSVPTVTVFWNTLVMAVASGLGAVPFYFVKKMSKQLVGLSNAIACGVMLAASFDLLHEGEPYGPMLVVLGIIVGMLFIKYSQAYLEAYENVRFGVLEGSGARKILLVIGVMAAHAIGEGAGVGVSYSGSRGWSRGVLVTLAIGLHNIPEGLAVATVMVSMGESVGQALLWSIYSSLPQTLAAVPAFLFVEAFTTCLPVAMGFAAGSMIWVVFSELIPDALENVKPGRVATAATLSAAWLEGMRMILAQLENDGQLGSPIQADVRAAGPAFAALLPALLVPTAVVIFLTMSLPARPVFQGLLVGLKTGWGCTLVLRELLAGKEPIAVTILWCFVGIGITAGVRSVISAETAKEPQGADTSPVSVKVEQGYDPDPPVELPRTWPPQPGVKPQTFSALAVCLASIGALGVVEGLRLARAMVLRGGEVSHLLLPAALTGALLGTAIGLATLLFALPHQRRWLLASILVALPVLSALASILGHPLGVHDVPVDPTDTVGKTSAATGAALVYVSCTALWPFLQHAYPRGPWMGTALGALATLLVLGGMEIMCRWSPYCLR